MLVKFQSIVNRRDVKFTKLKKKNPVYVSVKYQQSYIVGSTLKAQCITQLRFSPKRLYNLCCGIDPNQHTRNDGSKNNQARNEGTQRENHDTQIFHGSRIG